MRKLDGLLYSNHRRLLSTAPVWWERLRSSNKVCHHALDAYSRPLTALIASVFRTCFTCQIVYLSVVFL